MTLGETSRLYYFPIQQVTSSSPVYPKLLCSLGFPGSSVVKNLSAKAGNVDSMMPWRRKQQATPVFLPGESHGQGLLVGYSSGGRKELDTVEQLSWHAFCSLVAL